MLKNGNIVRIGFKLRMSIQKSVLKDFQRECLRIVLGPRRNNQVHELFGLILCVKAIPEKKVKKTRLKDGR